MRSSSVLATCVALALVVPGLDARAQVLVPVPAAPLSAAPLAVDDLELAPDEEVVVREYIVRRAPAPVRYQQDITLRPGSVVPGYVELESMAADSDPRLRRFGYFVSPDAKIVVVNPATRQVVRILDR